VVFRFSGGFSIACTRFGTVLWLRESAVPTGGQKRAPAKEAPDQPIVQKGVAEPQARCALSSFFCSLAQKKVGCSQRDTLRLRPWAPPTTPTTPISSARLRRALGTHQAAVPGSLSCSSPQPPLPPPKPAHAAHVGPRGAGVWRGRVPPGSWAAGSLAPRVACGLARVCSVQPQGPALACLACPVCARTRCAPAWARGRGGLAVLAQIQPVL
jgi:hypothetical protein